MFNLIVLLFKIDLFVYQISLPPFLVIWSLVFMILAYKVSRKIKLKIKQYFSKILFKTIVEFILIIIIALPQINPNYSYLKDCDGKSLYKGTLIYSGESRYALSASIPFILKKIDLNNPYPTQEDLILNQQIIKCSK